MGLTERVKNRAKHPTGGAVTGRLAAHDPRNNSRVNSVADRVGHGKGVKGTSIEDARNHHSAPLTTLQDPAAFGPPPKHVNYHGTAAGDPPALPSSSKPAPPSSKPAPPESRVTPYVPGKPVQRPITSSGLGGAIPKAKIEEQTKTDEERAAEEAANKPPPVPYRLDTTGLSTTGLPKPPVRRVESPEVDSPARPLPTRVTAKPKPQPPPRLPARQNSNPTEFTPPAPPTYTAATEPEPQHVQPAAPTSMSQLSELQSRFNRLPGRVSSPPAQPPRPTESPAATSTPPPDSPAGGGTTWAQKQAALRTASQLNNDPSSVSTTDAAAAASTARDFHQRHGDQVASGWQKAKALDSKYGIRGKVGGMVPSQEQGAAPVTPSATASPPEQTPGQPQSTLNPGVAAAVAAKKAPPPAPPPKRSNLHGHAIGAASAGDAPPPIPLSSKPT